MPGISFKKFLWYLPITVLTLCALIFASVKLNLFDFLYSVELKTFDLREQLTADKRVPNGDIVILTVDDASYEYFLNKYGEWPLPRDVYAKILKYINSQKPYLTIFDFLFIHSLKSNPGSDKLFADTIKSSDNAFVAISFDNRDFDVRFPTVLPENLAEDLKFESKDFKPHVYSNCRPVFPELLNATKNIGHINTPKDFDGITRKIPLFVGYPKYRMTDKGFDIERVDYYPYLTLRAVEKYFERKYGISKSGMRVNGHGELEFSGRKYFVNNGGEAYLHWYGENGLKNKGIIKSFVSIPLYKVEQAATGAKVLSTETFKNKVVFLGTSIGSLADIKSTPVSDGMPGVAIHATMFSNMTNGGFVKELPVRVNVLISIIFGIVAAIPVFTRLSLVFNVFLTVFIYLFYGAASTYLLNTYNIWIWTVLPALFGILAILFAYVTKYLLKSEDFDYMYKLATTDGLTELYNHRFFREQLKICILDSQRYNTPFSLIMIDIDYFKKFNDTFGHRVGDAVLRQVASIIKKTVRNSDIVCRYGGEEMSVILKNTSYESAVKIAAKICFNVAGTAFKVSSVEETQVTVSLGVSSYPLHGKTDDEIIESSDKALYNAKENGRNRVGKNLT